MILLQEKEQDPAEVARQVAKAIVKQVGLGLATLAYVVGGAYLFMWIESDNEDAVWKERQQMSIDIDNQRVALAHAFWAHKFDSDYNVTVFTMVEDYHKNITKAMKSHMYA